MAKINRGHMIYLLVFGLSAIFLYLAEKKLVFRQGELIKIVNKFDANCRLALLLLALALPILLATMRDISVGIDVSTYMLPLYRCSLKSNGLISFFENIKFDAQLVYIDKGYALIAYFACKIFRSVNGLFFANALLTIVPIFYAIKNFNKYCKKRNYNIVIPLWLGMFIYYCCFYNNSLNQVRQIICCSLLLCAFALFLNRKYLKTCIIFFVAISIHVSSIVFLIILGIYLVAKSNHKWLRILFVVVLALFFVFSIQIFHLFMVFLNRLGLIPQKYIGEIFQVEYGDRNINLSWVFLSLLSLLATFVYWINNKNQIYARFLLLITLTLISLFNISSYYSSFGRLQLYFLFYCIPIFPLYYNICKHEFCEAKVISNVFVIFVVLLFWVVAVGLLDYTGTLMYKFI